MREVRTKIFHLGYGYPSMNQKLSLLCCCVLVWLVTACAAVNPVPKQPDVKLVGLRMLPAQGLLQQHIAIDLNILNPNTKDLSIRSISYSIGIEGINVLTGVSDKIPVLTSMQETPVTLEVSADIIQVLRLAGHLVQSATDSPNGVEKVNYNFSAVIDFSAWLPAMHVDKKGVIPLRGQR